MFQSDDEPVFVKSSFSNHKWIHACVEVAIADEGIRVRDSKDRAAGTLKFTPDEWRAFVAGVKGGEFDL